MIEKLGSSGITTITASQAKLLNDIQIPVCVEIGELILTGAQLVDLLEGQTFEFMFDAHRPLALKVGSETIAFAIFVMDGERLELEIIDLPQSNSETNCDDMDPVTNPNNGGHVNGFS
jgi:flagellar motor switch/type III secretory pathway protein FliN